MNRFGLEVLPNISEISPMRRRKSSTSSTPSSSASQKSTQKVPKSKISRFLETEKSARQVIDDLDNKETENYYNPEDWAVEKAKELGFPVEYEDEDFLEQRVFMREHEPSEEQYWKKNYDPYEQDLYHFPDSKLLDLRII